MKKNLTILIGILVLAVIAAVVLVFIPSEKVIAPTTGGTTQNEAPGIADLITVIFPTKNAPISSPVVISGKARGNWFFEASFPIEILNASGKSIAQSPAKAQGDWMTTQFVPFSVSLTYPVQPAGSRGTVVLHKDNPSGEPARDQSVSIPIIFK